MDKRDLGIIHHIKSYCEDIAEYIDRFGSDYHVFISDSAYYNAVCMCVLQIGELSNKLSDGFREETKNKMPWDMIRGMRNMLAHVYDQMDDAILWETAKNDIPKVLEFCNEMTAHQA